MNRWFVVHDLLAYSQHPDMIGNVVEAPGMRQPKFSAFAEIEKGDRVVYYATQDCVVVGIFEVVSDIEYLPHDRHWKEIMIYRIKPVQSPPPGNYLDLRKLIKDPNVDFDMFPKKTSWGVYLQGQTCKLLTEKDYLTLKDSLSRSKYLKSTQGIKIRPTRWQREHGKKVAKARQTKARRHQSAIDKWKTEEEKKFGLFKPDIKTNTVDINEILPRSVWLKENTKYVDGLASLQIGGQPIYQSILEVQHRGSKEDLCVRVSIVLPFVTKVDVVSDEDNLKRIRELLERITDPNIVKSRVRFYSFREFFAEQ